MDKCTIIRLKESGRSNRSIERGLGIIQINSFSLLERTSIAQETVRTGYFGYITDGTVDRKTKIQ